MYRPIIILDHYIVGSIISFCAVMITLVITEYFKRSGKREDLVQNSKSGIFSNVIMQIRYLEARTRNYLMIMVKKVEIQIATDNGKDFKFIEQLYIQESRIKEQNEALENVNNNLDAELLSHLSILDVYDKKTSRKIKPYVLKFIYTEVKILPLDDATMNILLGKMGDILLEKKLNEIISFSVSDLKSIQRDINNGLGTSIDPNIDKNSKKFIGFIQNKRNVIK